MLVTQNFNVLMLQMLDVGRANEAVGHEYHQLDQVSRNLGVAYLSAVGFLAASGKILPRGFSTPFLSLSFTKSKRLPISARALLHNSRYSFVVK